MVETQQKPQPSPLHTLSQIHTWQQISIGPIIIQFHQTVD